MTDAKGDFPWLECPGRPATWRFTRELSDPRTHDAALCNICCPLTLGYLPGMPYGTLFTEDDEKARARLLNDTPFPTRDACAYALTSWITGLHSDMETRMWRLLNAATGGVLAETTVIAEELGQKYFEEARWPCVDAPATVHVYARPCMRKRRSFDFPSGEYYTPRLVVQVATAQGLLQRRDYVVHIHPHWWNVLVVLPVKVDLPATLKLMTGTGPMHDITARPPAKTAVCGESQAFRQCTPYTLKSSVTDILEYIQRRREEMLLCPDMGFADTTRVYRSIDNKEDIARLVASSRLAHIEWALPKSDEATPAPVATTPLKPAMRRVRSGRQRSSSVRFSAVVDASDRRASWHSASFTRHGDIVPPPAVKLEHSASTHHVNTTPEVDNVWSGGKWKDRTPDAAVPLTRRKSMHSLGVGRT